MRITYYQKVRPATSTSSCGELWPKPMLFWALRAKDIAFFLNTFLAQLMLFWCSVVTLKTHKKIVKI